MEAILGRRYKDNITGFEGTAVSRTEYLYGCVRVALEGLDGNKPYVEWFDEQRLIDVVTEEPVETTATTGGPHPTPPSRDPR